MTFLLSPVYGRAFALLIFILILFLSYQFLLLTAVGVVNYKNEEIALIERRLSKRYRVTEPLKETRNHLEKLNNTGFGETPYLGGDTPTASAAELQLFVRQKLKLAKGEILSMNILPAHSTGDFTRVSIRIKARLYAEKLPELIYSIETMEPSIFIDRILIRSNERVMSNTKLTEHQLSIEANLSGYSLKRSAL